MAEMAKEMARPARRLRKLSAHLAGGPCAQSEAVAEPQTPEQSLTDAERDTCIVRPPAWASVGPEGGIVAQRTHAPP